MQQEIKYRWIQKHVTKVNGKDYPHFTIVINGKYRFGSTSIEMCYKYVERFATENNIDHSKLLRNGKHPRIAKNF